MCSLGVAYTVIHQCVFEVSPQIKHRWGVDLRDKLRDFNEKLIR